MFDSLPAVLVPHVCVGCAAAGRRLPSSAATAVMRWARGKTCHFCRKTSPLYQVHTKQQTLLPYAPRFPRVPFLPMCPRWCRGCVGAVMTRRTLWLAASQSKIQATRIAPVDDVITTGATLEAAARTLKVARV